MDVKPSILACASLLSSIAGLVIETGEDMSLHLSSLISCDKVGFSAKVILTFNTLLPSIA